MSIIIPINGHNERMGKLFETDKHLLLYKGLPAIERTLMFLVDRFPEDDIHILTNCQYIDRLSPYNHYANIINIGQTDSQVETLHRFTHKLNGPVMFVDCDIIPLRINPPKRNTVYVFENTRQEKQYSNYVVSSSRITGCNEKETVCKYAGAGMYYFEDVEQFNFFAPGKKSISEVIREMIIKGSIFRADPDNEIFRFGTLNDIIS